VLGAQRERHSTLRERLARTEREIAALRERDAALSAATETLRAQLTAATAATQAPAGSGEPHASAAATTAAATAVTRAPARPVPPASATTTAPATVAVRSTPVQAAAAAPAADVLATIPNQTWLAVGLGMLALLALLVVRRRHARTRDAQTAQDAARPRQGDEEASLRRLAELRDIHASRSRAADAVSPPARVAASADVRHTDSARASALAKEAAVHLAYGDHDAAHTSIVEAIRLAPHQDEHKMMLMTVYQAMGKHERARAIVDELLNRREQLSGEVREQVDQQVRRLVRA
jgi:Tfp pilus assembly protein FimV